MNFKLLTVTALSLALGASFSLADGHADPAIQGAIKARQGQMQIYRHNLGIIGAMAKGEMDYDAAMAHTAADNLGVAASLNAMTMWPQGSDNASARNTNAKPEIWANFPDVGAKAADLDTALAAMAVAAGQDLNSLRGAMGMLGKACGACHKAYRSE